MDKKHQSQARMYTRWHFRVYATVGTLEDLVVRQRRAVKVRNPFSTPVAERPLRRKITQEIGLRLQVLASNEASMELQVSAQLPQGHPCEQRRTCGSEYSSVSSNVTARLKGITAVGAANSAGKRR
jgi:hypothetical protein